MTTKQIIAKIKAHEKRLAKERDSLDYFISELEGLREVTDRAGDSLNEAVYCLGELV